MDFIVVAFLFSYTVHNNSGRIMFLPVKSRRRMETGITACCLSVFKASAQTEDILLPQYIVPVKSAFAQKFKMFPQGKRTVLPDGGFHNLPDAF
jgi:hypothetical protein